MASVNEAEETLSDAASRQMKELALTPTPTATPPPPSNGNGFNKTPSKPRSSSLSRTALLSPTTSNHGSEQGGEDLKKLPMNKITVGHAPSPQISKATSKINSLANSAYKPPSSKVKIEHKKLEWNAKSKIGSLGNLKHEAGGGDVKIESKKLSITASSRIGSLSNTSYQPGGGSKKIFDDKDYLKRARSSATGKNTAENKQRRSSSTSGSVQKLEDGK